MRKKVYDKLFPKKAWIGVDFDGTLIVDEEEFIGYGTDGTTVKPMADMVRNLLNQGVNVKIFTARCGDPNLWHRWQSKRVIRRFCLKEFGKVLPITNKKDLFMIALYDDSAISVKKNIGQVSGFNTPYLNK